MTASAPSAAATELVVLENGKPLAFTFADCLRYHGFGFPGGVAHGFKVLERALPLLGDGAPVERREIRVETAFPGPGARDAIELVTRAATGGRYVVDAAFAGPEVPESPAGRYFFRLIVATRAVELVIRPGFVVPEFLALGRKRDRSAAEEARLTVLKQEMADRLMAAPAADVYAATVVAAPTP
jgi:hypothetical protein